MSKPILDDAALKGLLGGMTEAELRKLLEASEGLAKYTVGNTIGTFIPNEKQLEIAASKKKNVVVFGGNRCLGGETEIYDPIANVSRRVDEIDGPFHVYAWDGWKRVVAKAEAPFAKEPQDIYKIVLDDGSWFTCSPAHRVLTPGGWSSLEFLGLCGRNPIYSEVQHEVLICQPRSIAGTCQSTRGASDPHLTETTRDFQSDCLGYHHLRDGQLHSVAELALGYAPSQADVQGHSRTHSCDSGHAYATLTPSDHPLQSKQAGTHAYRIGRRPSTQDGLGQSVDPCVDTECLLGNKLLKFAWRSLQAVLRFVHGLNHHQSIAGSPELANPICADSVSLSEDILRSCSITSVKKVIGVEWLRKDLVWDFTVPGYENYECAGVIHHNSGKSHISAFMVACHATGVYPDWWEGIRFDSAPLIGVISITAEQLRKSAQKKLMGEFYNIGTGFIPKEKIIRTTTRQGVVGAFDTVLVKHISGGVTKIEFMLNEQGQEKFMGFEWDFAWGDEELDKEIFDEVKMRLMDRGGYFLLSFAPLKGYTELIQHIDELPEEYVDKFYLNWADNPHLPKEAVAEMEATMSDSDKESRKLGRANFGEGRIFTFPPDKYTCDPFEVEPWWPVLGGLDPGYGHPTASCKAYIDPESGVVYVTAEYWNKENLPIIHAPTLLNWGNIEFKIDRASRRRSPTDGKDLFTMYQELGLNVSEAETDAGSLEASIAKISTLIVQGRLQIFKTCRKLLDQMAMYRRARNKSTGKVHVVAKDNDVVDSLRYIILHLDEARPAGVPKKIRYSSPKIVDFQPIDPRIGY